MDEIDRALAALDRTPLDVWKVDLHARVEREHRVIHANVTPIDDRFFDLWTEISNGPLGEVVWHSWRVRVRAELGDRVARVRWSGSEMSMAEEELCDDLPGSEDVWLPAGGAARIVVEAAIELYGPRGRWWRVTRGATIALADEEHIRAAMAPIHGPRGEPFDPAERIEPIAIAAADHDALIARPSWQARGAVPVGVPERAWGWDRDDATGRAAWPITFPGDDGEHASLVAWHDADGALGQAYVPAPLSEVMVSPHGWIDVRDRGALYRIDPARGSVVRVVRG